MQCFFAQGKQNFKSGLYIEFARMSHLCKIKLQRREKNVWKVESPVMGVQIDNSFCIQHFLNIKGTTLSLIQFWEKPQ